MVFYTQVQEGTVANYPNNPCNVTGTVPTYLHNMGCLVAENPAIWQLHPSGVSPFLAKFAGNEINWRVGEGGGPKCFDKTLPSIQASYFISPFFSTVGTVPR